MKRLHDHAKFSRITSALIHLFGILSICIFLLIAGGCATINVGYDFPDEQVVSIRVGQTTKDEIHAVFGEPWRVGLENGLETWTYGKYSYRGSRETDAKDLVVRFTDKDIVESYTFSKTNR